MYSPQVSENDEMETKVEDGYGECLIMLLANQLVRCFPIWKDDFFEQRMVLRLLCLVVFHQLLYWFQGNYGPWTLASN